MVEELGIRHIMGVLDEVISQGKRKLAIYPYGDVGRLVERILAENYGLEPEYIIDNKKYDGSRVLNMAQVQERGDRDVCVLVSSFRSECYQELRDTVRMHFPVEQIVDLFPRADKNSFPTDREIRSILKKIDENLERMGIDGTDYKHPAF